MVNSLDTIPSETWIKRIKDIGYCLLAVWFQDDVLKTLKGGLTILLLLHLLRNTPQFFQALHLSK